MVAATDDSGANVCAAGISAEAVGPASHVVAICLASAVQLMPGLA
jgi:hypothetical protein